MITELSCRKAFFTCTSFASSTRLVPRPAGNPKTNGGRCFADELCCRHVGAFFVIFVWKRKNWLSQVKKYKKRSLVITGAGAAVVEVVDVCEAVAAVLERVDVLAVVGAVDVAVVCDCDVLGVVVTNIVEVGRVTVDRRVLTVVRDVVDFTFGTKESTTPIGPFKSISLSGQVNSSGCIE